MQKNQKILPRQFQQEVDRYYQYYIRMNNYYPIQLFDVF